MFELNQLRAFIAVAEELHFGRAAERLHMTQPPLSRRIGELERTLAVTLLNRSNRVVSLTAAGRSFLADARRILQLAEEARLSVRRVAAGEQGALTIGFIPASGYELLPRLVALAGRVMPGVQLILQELVTASQLDRLVSRRIDIGILRQPVDRARIETFCVAKDRMLLAVPKTHAFAGRSAVALTELEGEPFIMYAPIESPYHYNLLASAFSRADVRPNFVQHGRETHTILALVGSGIGLAIVPESATRLRPETVHICTIEATALVSQLWFGWLRTNDNPALEPFCRMVRDHIATS